LKKGDDIGILFSPYSTMAIKGSKPRQWNNNNKEQEQPAIAATLTVKTKNENQQKRE